MKVAATDRPQPPRQTAAGVALGAPSVLIAPGLAALGALLVLVMVPVLAHWVVSPAFRPVPTDPASYPGYFVWLIPILQYGVGPGIAAATAWMYLFRPWRRAGHLTFDGMMVIAAASINLTDCFVNYAKVNFTYSAAFLNFGNWAAFTPGQIANGTWALAEPLLFVPTTYLWFVVLWAVAGSAALRWARWRHPGWGLFLPLAALYLINAGSDVLLEGFVNVRLQLYAFLSTYPPLTLFAGKPWQFPLYNSFLWSFVLTGLAAARAYTDPAGRSFIEASAQRAVGTGVASRALACLALIGLVNAIYVLAYFVPFTWLTLHGGPVPPGVPAHLLGGYCGPGARQACPV
jgi:hypothetical protein